MNRILPSLLVSVAASCAPFAFAIGQVTLDPELPEYRTVSGVSGTLNSMGSDTLNNLMSFWAEAFKAKYPDVNIQIEGKGSSTAPAALLAGVAQLGPMSRPMKREEIAEFEKKYGYKPTEVRVAIDALAVFAHKDNPVTGLTMRQVDGVFSSTRKSGSPAVKTWGDLGVTGDLAARPVSLFGRNSASGTYGFFKEHALNKGDFLNTVKEQPGSSTVVQGVANDIAALGYSGIGYVTSGVKPLPLADGSGKYFAPTYENCLSGDYPLSRFLVVYVNRAPGKRLEPVVEEFLKFVASKEGQSIVLKDGYYPLTAEIAKEIRSEISPRD